MGVNKLNYTTFSLHLALIETLRMTREVRSGVALWWVAGVYIS